jgi:hypothetical protein
MSIHNFTGQWYDPDFGRMLASTISPSSIRVSKIKKRSSLLAICWGPDLLLDQVKVALPISMSTHLRLSMSS